MSVPISAVSGVQSSEQHGAVPLTGQVSFGWLGEAWKLFMAQMGVWAVATLALLGPSVLLGVGFYAYLMINLFAGGFPPPTHTLGAPPAMPPMFAPANINKLFFWEVVAGLLLSVYSAYVYGGMLRMAVRQVRGYPPAYRDIFAGGPLFGRVLGATFLLGGAFYAVEAICLGPGYFLVWRHAPTGALVTAFVIGGLALLALLAVLPGLLLPSFALMADGERVLPALRRSVRAMKAHWLPASGFVALMGIVVYVSEIPCGVGLLATLPMIALCTALAYRDLLGMPDRVAPPAPVYPAAPPGVWPPPPTAG